MRNKSVSGVSRALGGLVLTAALPWCALAQAQPPLPPPAALPLEPTPVGPIPPPSSADSATTNPPRTKPQAPQMQPGESIFVVASPFTKITLRVRETRVLELGNRIKIVDGFDQEKVGVTALSPHRIRIHAEHAGVTTVKLIDEFDSTHTLEVFVEPDTRELKAYLDRLFPGTSIEVIGIRDGVVLRGWVTQPSQIPEIMGVAEQFYPIVQPQLTVSGPSQVQLHVKVIEVQRSKLRELGFNFLLQGQNYEVASTLAGVQPASLRFAITGGGTMFEGFLRALQEETLAKILAEPILVTTSGRPATVHSGGEFPVPVPQGFGNLSITWKEIGVKLEAVPIILGNGRLRLDLAPEVSERDYSNSVTINGENVPGIASRSVNTQVEMQFGETLMIGGLISTRKLGSTQKVPFLGELPWIGAAFSRKRFQDGETELVILVTPQMVAPMAPHQVPPGGPGLNSSDPTMRELFLDGNLELPVFGPECPYGNCPPSGGLIGLPGTAPMIPATEPLPVPAAVSARAPSARSNVRGEIQQTSGEQPTHSSNTRSTTVNPFQLPLESTEFKPARIGSPHSGVGPSRQQTAEPAFSGKPSETHTLPGMIEPKSATANQPASAAN